VVRTSPAGRWAGNAAGVTWALRLSHSARYGRHVQSVTPVTLGHTSNAREQDESADRRHDERQIAQIEDMLRRM
jgi:hypothetical protein